MLPRAQRRRPELLLVGAVLAALLAGGVAAATDALRNDPGTPPSTPTTTAPSAPTTTATTSAPPSTTAAPASLPAISALERVWSRTPEGCVAVAAGGRILYERAAATPLAPASVTKVLTAAGALEILGPDTRFTTVLRGRQPIEGVIEGDVLLVGGGDPVLGTDAWASARDVPLHTSLDALADQLVVAGVTAINGSIVGDESRYDRDRTVDSWPRRLVADGESGPLSALMVNDGFRVWGHPGVPFANPPEESASLFAELIGARGIAVQGGRAADRETAAALGPAAELANVESAPIGDLVGVMLRESDNETAELLLKEIGFRVSGEGTTRAGAAAVRDLLSRRGLPIDGVVIADGSGLSDDARVTCQALLATLTAEPGVVERLAIAGATGTLRNRFANAAVAGRLRGKTGSLNGIATLAGTISSPDGPVTFSYVINGLPTGVTGRSLQDAMVDALAQVAG